MTRSLSTDLFAYYETAKTWIERSDFSGEIHWQAELQPADFSESDFLREYAWVVLNSGFREAVIRKYFDYISLCYCDWSSAKEIFELGDVCSNAAARAFGNIKKLRAITRTAGVLDQIGFANFKDSLIADFDFCQSLPFIGPITARHLAKNLGFDVAKPDRHLARLAMQFGYCSVHDMCLAISERTGDRLSVADIVLWRFAERSKARPT